MKSPAKILHRTWQLLRERGPASTFWLALRTLAAPVAEIGIIHFFECDLRRGLPQVRPLPGIIAREAFLEDIDLLDGIENASERKADAIHRLKNGERWFVGIDAANGKLTNYRWVSAMPTLIPELRSNVVPKTGEVFIYALYTVPEYRRRGIDSFTRHYTYDLLYKTAGVTRVLATIFAGNYASLQASRQFLREIGKVWYVSIPGRGTRLFMWPNSDMPALVPASPNASPQRYRYGYLVRAILGALVGLAQQI
jgi:hypothetical protein